MQSTSAKHSVGCGVGIGVGLGVGFGVGSGVVGPGVGFGVGLGVGSSVSIGFGVGSGVIIFVGAAVVVLQSGAAVYIIACSWGSQTMGAYRTYSATLRHGICHSIIS